MSLLSRVAERIYWSARYLERAETTSRLARVYGNLLLDLPRQAGLKWDAVIQITRRRRNLPRAASEPRPRHGRAVLRRGRDNPSSVRSSLLNARESIRTTRDIVPSEAWRSVNELCMYVSEELDAVTSHRRRYGIHTRVVEGCQQISGLLHDTMSHDSGYQFFRVGRGIERADMTTRIIDVAAAIADRPRRSRAFRQHAVDGRAAIAVGVPDVPAASAPAHLRPRRDRLSAEGRAVPARVRVLPARDRRGARGVAAQRRAASRSSASCGACSRCSTSRECRIARAAPVDRRRAARARTSCTGSSKPRGSGRRRALRGRRRQSQTQSQSEGQTQSQSQGQSSSPGVSALAASP